jgi:hypothetical protein
MCQDEPKDVTLPMIEVPDGLGKPGRVIRRPERSELLGSSIELSDTADQRFAARDQATWKRLSGSVCSSCGETQRIRKIDYVDPIAVLNAKVPAFRQNVLASRAVQPSNSRSIADLNAKVAAFRQTVLASRAAQPSHNHSVEALKAKVAAFRQTVLASRAVQPSHKHRVRLTHRRKHKSTLYAYYSRFRYALLKWRKQHRYRTRLVQR